MADFYHDVVVPAYELRAARYRMGPNEAARYRAQQEAASVANYRTAWSQDRGGYFGQFKLGDEWHDCRPGVVRTGHVDAVLDCKLAAAAADEQCRMHPEIKNLTCREATE